MKVKKKFIGCVLHVDGRNMYLEEVMDKNDLKFLKLKFPKFLEPIKKKKDDSTKKN
jgi:hypothetical protein